jgi:signal transduction histidine kinase
MDALDALHAPGAFLPFLGSGRLIGIETDGYVSDDALLPPLRADELFAGEGEMRALCRAFDWGRSPLGDVSEWPRALRTAVRAILASRHPMFLFWGPELVQIYNDAYRPSLGRGDRHPRALGMRGREFWTDTWDTIGPRIEQVMSGGESTWHEDQSLPVERNGRMEGVWWTCGYSPVFGDDGSVAATLVVRQETPPRVLAECERDPLRQAHAQALERSRLAYAFQKAPSFLAVLRGDNHIFEMANDACHEIFGRRDLIGKPLFAALPDVRDQGFEQLLDEVLRTGEPFVGREMRLFLDRLPGEPPRECFLDLTYIPIVEPDGSRSGVVAHGIEVTEQVLARREVERLLRESERARNEAEAARAAAEAADNAKSRFLATMSHEMRTPLNAIQGHLQLLELAVHGPLNDAQRDALSRVNRAQRHLLGLVNDVLGYVRLGSSSVEYDIRPLRLAEVVADVLPMVEPQLSDAEIKLDVRLGSDADGAAPEVEVMADREKLGQILLNLLSNAVKFTPPGGRVVIELATRDDGSAPEHTAFLRVSDTGIGIATDKLELIFEPFVQVRSEYSRTWGGTGLGLAISRDLARGMGGDLRARSVEGVGSSFTVSLASAASPATRRR